VNEDPRLIISLIRESSLEQTGSHFCNEGFSQMLIVTRHFGTVSGSLTTQDFSSGEYACLA